MERNLQEIEENAKETQKLLPTIHPWCIHIDCSSCEHACYHIDASRFVESVMFSCFFNQNFLFAHPTAIIKLTHSMD